MKQEFKIISDLIEKNTRVLDVGCGDGILMEYLKYNKERPEGQTLNVICF